MQTVTTIIAVRNGEKYLQDALDSCFAQSYEAHEIVVVDDGSEDATPQIVQRQSGTKLRYVRRRHRGLAAARNTGICAAAQSTYLNFLDCDDRLFPQGVATLLAAAAGAEHLGFVAGCAARMDAFGAFFGGVVGAQYQFQPRSLLFRNPFHVGAVLVRRDWIEKLGGFCETLGACEDWDLWIQLAKAACPMKTLDNQVSVYRTHVGQMSRDPRLMRDATFEVLARAFAEPCPADQWRQARREAYLRAHLRCAARFLCVADEREAIRELRSAVATEPKLLLEDGERIRETMATWESDPAIRDLAEYKRNTDSLINQILHANHQQP